MNWVAPIKDEETLEKFKAKLREMDDKYYIMFEIGVGTGLQLQEILKFKNKDIRGKDTIEANIGTKNIKRTFTIPADLKEIIEKYTEGKDPDAYLILGHASSPAALSREQAYRALKSAGKSMGLTPLEGLIMGTRSGDIDPAVVQFICNNEGKTVDEVLNILNKKSGVLGMSGVSSDFRDLGAAADAGNHDAQVALEAFIYRVAKYIGAYTAAMNGVDAIAFTAGVGENDMKTRKAICEYLGHLGVKIDDEANNVRGKNAVISAPDSKVKVLLMPTNEELAIARDTLALVQ